MTEPILINLPEMNDQQRAAFAAAYQAQQKDEVAGVLLAVLLGGFGAHHFYLRRTGLGIVYLIFSCTGVTYLIAWIEAFFMPARVRQFNAGLSAFLAAAVTGQGGIPGFTALPLPTVFCMHCGTATSGGVRFCSRCGAAMAV
jgi:TM2 domain-containing membrane protein YozV